MGIWWDLSSKLCCGTLNLFGKTAVLYVSVKVNEHKTVGRHLAAHQIEPTSRLDLSKLLEKLFKPHLCAWFLVVGVRGCEIPYEIVLNNFQTKYALFQAAHNGVTTKTGPLDQSNQSNQSQECLGDFDSDPHISTHFDLSVLLWLVWLAHSVSSAARRQCEVLVTPGGNTWLSGVGSRPTL